jgi:hypothetical protein
MAVNDDTPEREGGRRLSISEGAVRDIVENAILKLQLKLTETFASAADVKRLEDALKDATDAANLRLDAADKRMEGLEKDKAGREAVTQYKKWLTGGALLATVFMAIQVAISIWLVTRGVHAPTRTP